ncbi:MAG: 50S ribosomal protein L30 [Fibrobacter sp.]|nr:50S ribosomal protein L30 [Fibrobacter sp.]
MKNKVRITQVISSIRILPEHRKSLAALGLHGKIGKSVEHTLNPAINGMLSKVRHLVKVEEI